jgi:hypothetical protein
LAFSTSNTQRAPVVRSRDDLLKRLVRAKCSAASRRDGAKLRWFPMLDGEFIHDPAFPDGFDTNHDAVKRAQDFRDECRQNLAALNGSA